MSKAGKSKGKGAPVLILEGGVLALLSCLILLLLFSFLILVGVFDLNKARQLSVAACAVGGLLGSFTSVIRVGHHSLPVGLCVGGLFFLLLVLLGILCVRTFAPGQGQLPLLVAALCAGGFAGLLGKKRKKRRI